MNNECKHELDLSTASEENYDYELCSSCYMTYSWFNVKCLLCGEVGHIRQNNCTCMVSWRDIRTTEFKQNEASE